MDCSMSVFPVLHLSSRVCSNSCLLSQWCYLTISPSVSPFFFCLHSFPAWRSVSGIEAETREPILSLPCPHWTVTFFQKPLLTESSFEDLIKQWVGIHKGCQKSRETPGTLLGTCSWHRHVDAYGMLYWRWFDLDGPVQEGAKARTYNNWFWCDSINFPRLGHLPTLGYIGNAKPYQGWEVCC